MDSLYLLIPFSAALVLALLAVFGWALFGGQFDDLEREGERILGEEIPVLDSHQRDTGSSTEESR
jgi:cbb3-type cytochrome oxidase maturation protein